MLERCKKQEFYGISDLEFKQKSPWDGMRVSSFETREAFPIASPVAFTSKVYETAPYVAKETAILSVAAKLLNRKILHTKLREQGGAYGGGASNKPLGGLFLFYAYRDPNLLSTLDVFDEALALGIEGQFTLEELEEAKLEVIQEIDSPLSPGSRGHAAYLWKREGKTLEKREAFRKGALTATKDEIKHALKQVMMATKTRTVTFCGKALVTKENETLKSNPFIIQNF